MRGIDRSPGSLLYIRDIHVGQMSPRVKNIFLYNGTVIENVTCTDTYNISANDL